MKEIHSGLMDSFVVCSSLPINQFENTLRNYHNGPFPDDQHFSVCTYEVKF